jgi:hypothetical protein
MANDTTYNFFVDSGLTTPFSGVLQLSHYTSLADNPQDTTLYLGSVASTGAFQLRASSNPGTDQITLTPTDSLPAWAVATAYTLGQSVEPTTPNTYRYIVTVAGTSHAATEPTWPTTIGNTVTDGTVTWKCEALKSPTTEIKLALTSGGLAGATPGGALNLGTTILSGSANAVEIHVRVTNTITTVTDTTGTPEITLYLNDCQEDSV